MDVAFIIAQALRSNAVVKFIRISKPAVEGLVKCREGVCRGLRTQAKPYNFAPPCRHLHDIMSSRFRSPLCRVDGILRAGDYILVEGILDIRCYIRLSP